MMRSSQIGFLSSGRMFIMVLKVLIGLLVGILVGLTGVGGALLLLPLLIFALGVPPITAVGSDAALNFMTKLPAGCFHWRQRTVNWRVVARLASGSIPGAIGGVTLLSHIRAVYGNGANDLLKSIMGLLLVSIPTLLLLQGESKSDCGVAEQDRGKCYLGITAIGALAGFLVGMTSVGSGSIVMMLLLLFYRFSPGTMVGTDIVHAVFLTFITSLLHFRLGTIDPALVASVLIGSIPGALLGTRLSTRVPVHWLRRILCVLLFATGTRMLWV